MDCILAPKAQESTVMALSNEGWGERPHLVNHCILINPLLTSIFFKSIPVSNLEYLWHVTWHRWGAEGRVSEWVGTVDLKSHTPGFRSAPHWPAPQSLAL